MKRVLIVWGGWKGHQPELVAEKLSQILQNRDYEVDETCDIAVLLNNDLLQYDVIIPIWSCGIKSNIYMDRLLEAIREGVGLVTFHGGIKWFEDEKYYEMIGALYIKDTDIQTVSVIIDDKTHQITKELDDYIITSENYYMQIDPSNHILAKVQCHNYKSPIAWVKNYGKGRVFYSSLAHSPKYLLNKSNLEMVLNAVDWCAKV